MVTLVVVVVVVVRPLPLLVLSDDLWWATIVATARFDTAAESTVVAGRRRETCLVVSRASPKWKASVRLGCTASTENPVALAGLLSSPLVCLCVCVHHSCGHIR